MIMKRNHDYLKINKEENLNIKKIEMNNLL